MIFLTEARSFVRCLRDVEENAAVLRVLYRKLGELDALQSVASYRRGMRQYAAPQFVEEPAYISAESVAHPLLRNAVSNSLTMDGRNVVITGSNMSGKSTFLHICAGLDSCDSGHVYIHGNDITAMKADELSRFRDSAWDSFSRSTISFRSLPPLRISLSQQ